VDGVRFPVELDEVWRRAGEEVIEARLAAYTLATDRVAEAMRTRGRFR
jgi:glutamate dehydrogenase/leucine dehydrogenase